MTSEGDRDRAAHDGDREAVPERLLERHRLGRGTPQQAPEQDPQVERVDPGAEDGQQRGEEDQGRQRGQADDGQTGVGEGAQEVHREHQHRGQRQPDGQRREQHGASGGLHRRGVRRRAGATPLPVSSR